MSLQDQAEHLWLTKGQKPLKDQQNLLDPYALYGFFTTPDLGRPFNRRAKSAFARTNSLYEPITKNRHHPPGYETPDFHVGHIKNPTPTPATSRPASSRSGYSSVKSRKMDHSSPTTLYLGSQKSRCKSAPAKPRKFIPRRPQTSKPGSRATSAMTSRGAPQRAWELRTNSASTHKTLLSPQEIQRRQKTRCKSAPLPYDFSKIELINEIPENGTDYERLHAMTRPLSCMPDLIKSAVTHNGLRHCCSAYNTRTTVPPETRQQFWPIPRPGVYRRGFVPQYFTFVKPIHITGESSPPTITCTKPGNYDLQDVEDLDEIVLFEESFALPTTPSELSISDQYDLSDTDADAMDDFNVREYLQSGIVSDPDDDDDELQLSPDPEQLEQTKDLNEDIQTPEIGVEIMINQSRQISPEPTVQPQEPEKTQSDEQLENIAESHQQEEEHKISEEQPVQEEPVEEPNNETELVSNTVDNVKKTEENIPEEVQESKTPLPPTPHPDPPRVTFVDSITITSYKPPETKPSKPILKQPKSPTKPPMEAKPPEAKKPQPRPMVERREADIRPQIKPGIILKPEPPKVQEEKQEEEVEPKPLEEKLPEPEFVQAPGAYRMYQSVDLYQHQLEQARTKKLANRFSHMPLPYTGISSYHQMMPESSSVMNAVFEDERRKKEGMKPWLQGRLALSKQTSRFELPMDIKLLESMTAMEYLTKYCIISTRRKALYKHVFLKVDKDRDGIIGFRELEKGLREIHVDSIDVKQVRNIEEMIGADEKTKFDVKQFSAIAAFSERILFSNFVTEETKTINNTKEIIEEADFCSLKWKLDGFNVNPTVRRILESL